MTRPGRPTSTNKRDRRLNAPATEIEVQAFTKACLRYKIEPPQVLRLLVDAFIDYANGREKLELPLRIEQTDKKCG